MERSKAYKVYSVLMVGWMCVGIIILFGLGFWTMLAWYLGGLLMPSIERKDDPFTGIQGIRKKDMGGLEEIKN